MTSLDCRVRYAIQPPATGFTNWKEALDKARRSPFTAERRTREQTSPRCLRQHSWSLASTSKGCIARVVKAVELLVTETV